jgi:tripartite ATP-independent transporter DctP family solute receptor
MGTRWISRLLVVFLVILNFILMISSNIWAQPKLVIKFGHHHAVGGSMDQYAHKFAELVKAKSKGEIEVRVFPGAQLGQEGEAAEGVHLGTLQTTIASSPFMSKYLPEMGFDYLPYLWDSREHIEKVIKGPIMQEVHQKLLAKSNVRILGWMQIGFRHMLFKNKEVKKVADMKGLKMRSPQIYFFIEMFRALGASPTAITWGEVYTALQTGVVDGLETPFSGAVDMKFMEVTKYWALTKHMFSLMPHHINETFYKGLSPNYQKIIQEAVWEAIAWNDKKAEDYEEQCRKIMEKRGMVFNEVNREEWRAAVMPVYEGFYRKAPEAKSIIEKIRAASK